MKPYLSIAELAQQIPYTEQSIRGMMRTGDLLEGRHYFRRGRRVLFKWAATRAGSRICEKSGSSELILKTPLVEFATPDQKAAKLPRRRLDLDRRGSHVMPQRPCRFDFRAGDPGRLQCDQHPDHVLAIYADPASRPTILRGLLERGLLMGEAEKEAARLTR